MSFIKKHEAADKNKKSNKKIEAELPFFITIVTLLATSGFGPYTIFLKIKELDLLPNVRIEAIKILKKIDILGKDPLVVMAETKERGISHFGEFLSGWVSSIQSGGDVVSYLKSKSADLLKQINDTRRPVIITQNGEPKAVIQDPKSYENMHNAIGMLKLISQGEENIKKGKTNKQEKVFEKLETLLKKKVK